MKTILINSKNHGQKECLVDDEDFEFLNQWRWKLLVSYNSTYAVRNVSKYLGGGRKNKKYEYKCILMHRLIMKANDDRIVDHKDHNGLNNQKSNLRLCTKADNNRNVGKHADAKYSKYKGVSFDKNRGKWISAVKFQRKTINLGRFDSEDAAAKAYNYKADELFGEFANLNNV